MRLRVLGRGWCVFDLPPSPPISCPKPFLCPILRGKWAVLSPSFGPCSRTTRRHGRREVIEQMFCIVFIESVTAGFVARILILRAYIILEPPAEFRAGFHESDPCVSVLLLMYMLCALTLTGRVSARRRLPPLQLRGHVPQEKRVRPQPVSSPPCFHEYTE